MLGDLQDYINDSDFPAGSADPNLLGIPRDSNVNGIGISAEILNWQLFNTSYNDKKSQRQVLRQ